MAEKKEITGLVERGENNFGIVLKVFGEGTTRTVYVGDRYAPEGVPDHGAYGTVTYMEYPAKQGRRVGSAYLEDFQTKEPPLGQEVHSNGNGSVSVGGTPRSNYVDHHASIAAEWAVGRAVELCCAEAKFAQDRGFDIEAIAKELLGMAQDLESFVGVGKDGWAKISEKSAEEQPA